MPVPMGLLRALAAPRAPTPCPAARLDFEEAMEDARERLLADDAAPVRAEMMALLARIEGARDVLDDAAIGEGE